jgi:hypothetical protein
MTIRCEKKSGCSFSSERDVCLYCQTKLREADRELTLANGRGKESVKMNSINESRERYGFEIVWTF